MIQHESMDLTHREKTVLAEIKRFAQRYGRWGTVREVGASLARRENLPGLSVASAFRSLKAKGVLIRADTGKSYGIKGLRILVKKAVLSPLRAANAALSPGDQL